MIDFQKILRENSPGREEETLVAKTVSELTSMIRDILKRDRISATPVLVGSVAKHTNLRNADIDIFIVFSRNHDRKVMETLGLKIGHEVIPGGKEKYAEHPYVSGIVNGRKVDVVPCFELEPHSKIISSVDRTPLHTQYVLAHLDEEFRKEVLLLKLFMKSIGVYGSEVKVQGFSGYVCELLVINLGKFTDILKTFSQLKGRLIIPGDSGLARRFDSPVIMEDPTDATRNAGAAVSVENLARMKIESRIFLEKPTGEFFVQPGLYPESRYREMGTCLRIIRLPRPDLVDDVIVSQAEKLRKVLVSSLNQRGFHCIDSEVNVNATVDILVETEIETLPAYARHMGPPVDSENTMEFVRKWRTAQKARGPYIIGDRLYVDALATGRTLDEAIREAMRKSNTGKHLNLVKNEMQIINPGGSAGTFEILGKFYSRGLKL